MFYPKEWHTYQYFPFLEKLFFYKEQFIEFILAQIISQKLFHRQIIRFYTVITCYNKDICGVAT